MSTILMERQEQLQKLDQMIVNSRKKLSSIVSKLGWSFESISKDVENMMICPFNESHRIPPDTLVKHLEICQWKAEGYGELDLPLSSPSLPPEAPSSIKFDEQLQDNVIKKAKQENPSMIVEDYHSFTVKWTRYILFGASGRLIARTSDRLIAEFTRDERRAMYEYVIANTVEPDIGKDIADMNKPKAPDDRKKSSYFELLAQERNLKRRRAKYRGVHTNKKSQVEILREVINQQMEMLSEYIAENNDDASDWVTIKSSTKDVKDVRECERNTEMPARSDCLAAEQSSSTFNNDRQYRETSSKRSEDSISQRRLSDDRRYDQRSYEPCDSRRKKELTTEMRNYTKKRDRGDRRDRESSEQRSHKSHHKSQRHSSKNRHKKEHKRTRSREHARSRSSRHLKDDDSRLDSMRDSQYEDQRTKKTRNHSR